MSDFAGHENLMSILEKYNKKVYENVMEAETYKEFNLLMKNYHLTNKIKKLKRNQRKLKKENKKLEKEKNQIEQEYNDILKENKQLMNSKSWKMTKPFRRIRNFK